MLPDAVRHRIDTLLTSADPLDQEVGRRLAGHLPGLGPLPPSMSRLPERTPSQWRHVDLVNVLAGFGNRVSIVGPKIKSGHEPLHGSRSGLCLVAWPESGRWWCSSCRRSGDAVGYVMEAFGVSYSGAADWLIERYGPPVGGVTRRTLRRRVFAAVIG
jgi:hypothetical protein